MTNLSDAHHKSDPPWSAGCERSGDGRVLRILIQKRSVPITFSEALRCWQDDAGFRSFFLRLLSDVPFSAFRWETPAVTRESAHRPFEFVALNSPELSSTPDASAFAEHFRNAKTDDGVVAFSNLGRDAVLVVPCPVGPESAYGHIASFVREAPAPQKHALWKRVGSAEEAARGEAPLWLSTAGAGVPWLRVRIDNLPKYYCHGPYRKSG
jgi:hypothetical protein